MFILSSISNMIVSGSTPLANILYNMDTFNVDVSNLRTIDNVGSEGSTADGLMYGSNHIYLGATQSVTYPIPYTLGSDLFTGTSPTGGAVLTVTPITDGYNLVNDGTSSSSSINRIDFTISSSTTTKYVLLSFNATINSGTMKIIEMYTSVYEPLINGSYTVVNGLNKILVKKTTASDTLVRIVHEDVTAYNADITNIDIQEVTNPNSYITYYDVSTKSHITVDNSSVTTNIVKKIETPTHHSNLFTTTVQVTAGDITALNANPEDIARMVKGVATFGTYSFTLADIEAFYPGNEGEAGGANIYDVTDGTWATFSVITNYTASCRTTYLNTNYGASNFLYTQDSTGRLTGMHTSGHIKSGTDGRNITIAMTSPYNHVVTKDIDKMEGNLTSCTITYSDTTTLVVP